MLLSFFLFKMHGRMVDVYRPATCTPFVFQGRKHCFFGRMIMHAQMVVWFIHESISCEYNPLVNICTYYILTFHYRSNVMQHNFANTSSRSSPPDLVILRPHMTSKMTHVFVANINNISGNIKLVGNPVRSYKILK
jgi:hypothetical protein